jgi:hypothetical protein
MKFGLLMTASLALSFALVSLACKHIASESGIQHDWGETRRDAQHHAFKDCDHKVSDIFPSTQRFISELAKFVMDANKDVFVDKLSHENFCFEVIDELDFAPGMDPESRTMIFSTGTFQYSELKVPEIAMALSHELAHASLLHGSFTYHPNFQPTEKFMALEKSLADITAVVDEFNIMAGYQETLETYLDSHPDIAVEVNAFAMNIFLNSTADSGSDSIGPSADLASKLAEKKIVAMFPKRLADQVEKWILYLRKLVPSIVPILRQAAEVQGKISQELESDPAVGPKEAYNWKEKEADEIGQEFYIKSGFPMAGAHRMQRFLAANALANAPSIPLNDCLAEGLAAVTLQELDFYLHNKVDRGKGSHPLPCWRILNAIYEQRFHVTDYSDLSLPAIPENLEYLRKQAVEEILKNSKFVTKLRAATNHQN